MQLPGPLREGVEQELSMYDGAQLRAAAAQLSEVYRKAGHLKADSAGRGRPAEALADDVHRAAYLAVRMPATFAAISGALEWTREVLGEAGGARIRTMLDLGSGPGTALWAATLAFPTLASATCVERNPRLVEIGRRMAAKSDNDAVREAQWICGDLTSELPLGSWELVVCAYALNEITEGHRARFIRQAWERCSQLFVVVEPGTMAGFANVLAVRSQMLAMEADPNSAPMLVAPCPHTLDCPAGAAGDWCHFAARVERSSLHRRLKDAELGHEDEKFSYVAFMRGLPAVSDKPQEAKAMTRIVRHLRIFSGYAQLTLCVEGRLEQTTVTRSQKEDWRRLKRLGWGDRW